MQCVRKKSAFAARPAEASRDEGDAVCDADWPQFIAKPSRKRPLFESGLCGKTSARTLETTCQSQADNVPDTFEGAEERPIRVGIIGLGRAGVFFHCRPLALNPGFSVAGVHDPRSEVAQEVAATYGCRVFESASDLIASADLDLVVIAVPTARHHEIAIAAIRAGKNILVEKPFACSTLEAENIFREAARAGVFAGGYHNRRFDPDIRALREILDSGEIGEVFKITLNLHAYARRKDWQTWRGMGGGALANWGAHSLDWCIHLFGTDLRCLHASLMQALNPGDAEDSFYLLLQTGRGILIQVEYLNFAAHPLPRWHVLGRFGSVISDGETFKVRSCDPSMMAPIEAETHEASDGTYSVTDDIQWRERVVPWGHWDNAPPFYESLLAHLQNDEPVPVKPDEILLQMRLIEEIRKTEIRRATAIGSE